MFADKEGLVWADRELRASLPVSPISILTAPLTLNIKAPELNSNLTEPQQGWNNLRVNRWAGSVGQGCDSLMAFSLTTNNSLIK